MARLPIVSRPHYEIRISGRRTRTPGPTAFVTLQARMRILMLAPHPGVRGAMPKHTPVLVEALRGLGCDVALEAWGRHRDDESVKDKLAGAIGDIPRIRRLLRTGHFDVMVVKTS